MAEQLADADDRETGLLSDLGSANDGFS
jgi:hypothetical protein